LGQEIRCPDIVVVMNTVRSVADLYSWKTTGQTVATEATFTVPSDQFPLGTLFAQLPNVTVELERLIPAQDVVIPYFWVRGTDVNDIESAFSEHPGVKEIRLVDSVDDEYLLRAEWALDYDDVITLLAETEIPLIEATGTNQQWTFEIRGDDRSDIAAFQRRCRELDIPITLTKLYALTPVETATEATLTDTQQEALILAYERGYFESLREVTLEALGEELGISQQAVGSRLRGGIKHVLGSTLSTLTVRP
jgi:predicted DNA binding protein